jgi:hypothetical protein
MTSSTWCYATTTVTDNATITTKVLSDADSCASGVGNGCGYHNTSADFVAGMTHAATTSKEFVFYLQDAAARAGAVYYFRLYQVFEDAPVPTAPGESYPSLIAEPATLTFGVTGLNSATTTAGIVTTTTSTPTTIAYGTLPVNTDQFAAQRLSLTTNATDGYRVFMYVTQQLLNVYGTALPAISGTNDTPVSWAVGCIATSSGCAGYHTTDATLSNTGSGATRFSPLDSYAGLSTSTQEVMYSPIPASDTHDIVYRVRANVLTPASSYTTNVVYVAVPSY